jgi:Kef-type K+ transport system membrane component KefB
LRAALPVLLPGTADALRPAGRELAAVRAVLRLGLGITAFPVLVRILAGRGMEGGSVGARVLAGAAIVDVTAWCLLAMVISLLGGDLRSSLWRIGWSVVFCAVLFGGCVRPCGCCAGCRCRTRRC